MDSSLEPPSDTQQTLIQYHPEFTVFYFKYCVNFTLGLCYSSIKCSNFKENKFLKPSLQRLEYVAKEYEIEGRDTNDAARPTI